MTGPRPDDGSFRRDIFKLLGLIVGALVLSLGVVIWAVRRGAAAGTLCLPVEDKLPGPDSMAVALVWHYECGSITRGMVGVNLQLGDAGARRQVQVMSAMDSSVSRLLHLKMRRPKLDVKWRSADTLDIGYEASANLIHSERRAGTVVVRYHRMIAADSAEPLPTPSRDGE